MSPLHKVVRQKQCKHGYAIRCSCGVTSMGRLRVSAQNNYDPHLGVDILLRKWYSSNR